MIKTYKTKFLAHTGRKIIIPPTTPDKYTSYQFDSIASLISFGWDKNDIAPIEKLFSEIPKSECKVMQSGYEIQETPNIDLFGSASWKQKTRADAAVFVLSALTAYMGSSGVALPPDGDEDIILYPMRA